MSADLEVAKRGCFCSEHSLSVAQTYTMTVLVAILMFTFRETHRQKYPRLGKLGYIVGLGSGTKHHMYKELCLYIIFNAKITSQHSDSRHSSAAIAELHTYISHP